MYRTSEMEAAYERWCETSWARRPIAPPPVAEPDRSGKVLSGVLWLFAALVLSAALLSGCGPSFEERCGLAGGRIEKYDCSTSYVTHHFDKYTSWTQPIESCSRRCIGTRAELGK